MLPDANTKCPEMPCNVPGESTRGTSDKYFSTQYQNQQYQTYQCPMSASGLGNRNCPFSPCVVDQSLGLTQMQSGIPCDECGTVQNPLCANQPMSGMGKGMGYSPSMTVPCMECGNVTYPPCFQPIGYSQHPNTPCAECSNDNNPPCLEEQEPTGNYQEIGASMGNNSLTIRVHKDKNKIEAVDEEGNVIDDSTSNCPCKPGRIGKRNGGGGGTALAMRPGVQQGNENLPFSFRMGKCGDAEGNVVVNPPVSLAPDGTQLTEFSDPNKERFILRIGKKSEGVNKKQNLELELCTPKGPDLKPPPKKETRDTQYDEKDFPVADSGKGKGAKGKGKGKGKGGKKGGKKKK